MVSSLPVPSLGLAATLFFGVAAAFRDPKGAPWSKAAEEPAVAAMTAADTVEITAQVKFDNFPGDITWKLWNTCDGEKLLDEGGPYDGDLAGKDATPLKITTPDGVFRFTIFDSYGDGLCCGAGIGGYTLTYKRGAEEKLIASQFKQKVEGTRNATSESQVMGLKEYCGKAVSGTASYNKDLKVPSCGGTKEGSCSTVGTGLLSCKTVTGEPNGPNTLDGCKDGNVGSCGTDESVEDIIVATVDGKPFSGGGKVMITTHVNAFNDGSEDQVDFFHTSNPGPAAVWKHVGSARPDKGGKVTVKSPEFALDASAKTQAVRVNLRWVGTKTVPPESCSAEGYNDVDDLAFAVEPGCKDLQKGFKCGMSPEIVGLWAGDEKYGEEGVVYDYCSRAIYNPAEGKNFLTWNGGYLGTGEPGEPQTCSDVGMNALAKTINGSWLPLLTPSEQYILNTEQKTCLPAKDCDYDVTKDYPGYTVKAKSCGAHLKKDSFRPDDYSCELSQVNIIEDRAGNKEAVVILSYYGYSGGYGNYKCPKKPTFDEAAFKTDPYMQGMTRFVLQANDLTDTFNTTMWDCLV